MSKLGTVYMIPSVMAEGSQDAVITQGVKDIIGQLNYFAVEEPRTARRFIRSVDKEKVLETTEFIVLNKDSDHRVISGIMQKLYTGTSVGVLSEAGCPGIADPGAKLVEEAHENGIKVVPLVGPSSILLALMASGMNGQSFAFHGYLPIKDSERKQAIKHLESLALKQKQTQLFMETPYRNQKLFEDVLNVCSPKTKLCIASNITASDEFILTLTIADWKQMDIDLSKKPTIFVLGV